MENIIKQLEKGAQHTRLSATEKVAMRSALVRHMQVSPVKNESLQSKKSYGILSPLQINTLRNKKTMPILVILGLLMGGSASFAAETTVPGDVLYPVKVHVNESVRGAVTVSPTAKAEWEIHLVERRLEEVEKLATRPNAAPQAQEQAQENLVKYTKHVEDRIAKFEEKEDGDHAIKVASDLSNVLASYEQLLASLATTQVAGTVVVDAMATSTPATTATSTATTTVSTVAMTTPVTTLTPANIAALREILSKLNEVQDDAEEKHKELKKKYHKEDREDGEEGSRDNENDHVNGNWTPAPVVTSTATSTNNTATTAATTTTNTTISLPSTFNIENRSNDGEERHREEIRSNSSIQINEIVQASSTVSTEKTGEEEKFEDKKQEDRNREGSHEETRDSHDND